MDEFLVGKIKSGGVNMKKYKRKTENNIPFDTAFDIASRYGTYEIQPTADTENEYLFIAQGFNPKIIETDLENPRQQKGEEMQF